MGNRTFFNSERFSTANFQILINMTYYSKNINYLKNENLKLKNPDFDDLFHKVFTNHRKIRVFKIV